MPLFQYQHFNSTRSGISDPVFRDAEPCIAILLLAPVKASRTRRGNLNREIGRIIEKCFLQLLTFSVEDNKDIRLQDILGR